MALSEADDTETADHRRGSLVECAEITVRGQPARVFVGGAGDALLLVHGGWGGAELHWNQVWNPLAKRYRVIAPDLPGLGWVQQPALSSVRAYAGWLLDLLDALGVERACCVGNSFGASVVWSLAGRAPDRCAGLVLVDGLPMPRTPLPLRLLSNSWVARTLVLRMVGKYSYSMTAVPRAFHDPAHAPAQLDQLSTFEWPIILPRFVDLLVAGDGPPDPIVKPLLLWGASDRLFGTTREDAERLHRRLSGSTLRWIENAGHFPQLEAPKEFVEALGARV